MSEPKRCECGACHYSNGAWWWNAKWIEDHTPVARTVQVQHCPALNGCGCRLSVVDGEPVVGEKYADPERDRIPSTLGFCCPPGVYAHGCSARCSQVCAHTPGMALECWRRWLLRYAVSAHDGQDYVYSGTLGLDEELWGDDEIERMFAALPDKEREEAEDAD